CATPTTAPVFPQLHTPALDGSMSPTQLPNLPAKAPTLRLHRGLASPPLSYAAPATPDHGETPGARPLSPALGRYRGPTEPAPFLDDAFLSPHLYFVLAPCKLPLPCTPPHSAVPH